MSRFNILEWLLHHGRDDALEPQPALRDWRALFNRDIASWDLPIDRAIGGGFIADRLAYAFFAGYQSGLQRMIPALPVSNVAALCVTESGGAHPKAIRSALHRPPDPSKKAFAWILTGHKTFATATPETERFLIAVSTGKDEKGRPRLHIVSVDRETPGLSIEPLKPLAFIPEIIHGALTLDSIEIQETMLLPGDGYRDYIKPFRTIEDLHVSAAIIGYLFRIACRYGWPHRFKEQMLSLITGISALSLKNPRRRDVHIVLGGMLAQWEGLVRSIESQWQGVDHDTRQRWQRDRVLMNLAADARSKRLTSAWDFYDL